MKRNGSIAFVFVPVCIEIARTRVPKPGVVVSSGIRKTHEKQPASGRSGRGSSIIRGPDLAHEKSDFR
jgi:hypothetical protein